jgi:hypothetical protein
MWLIKSLWQVNHYSNTHSNIILFFQNCVFWYAYKINCDIMVYIIGSVQ